MTDDTSNLGLTTGSNFTIQTLDEIDGTAEKLPSPALVTNAVLPENVTSERRHPICSVTDEATDGMRVHAQHEGDEQVVSVPESLERLLANPVVSGRVHQKHAEQHDVTRNATWLGVVDLESENRSNLRPLNIEEARTISRNPQASMTKMSLLDVVSSDMEDGEEQHGVCYLSMEPNVLIQRYEPNLRSEPSHQRTAHWQEDE